MSRIVKLAHQLKRKYLPLEAHAHAGGDPGHTHEAGAVSKPTPGTTPVAVGISPTSGWTDKNFIDNIQKTITVQFPWDLVEKQKPSVQRDGIMGPATERALADINKIFTEIKLASGLEAIKKINAGKLKEGASELWDASRELAGIVRPHHKYFADNEDQSWNYQKIVQYITNTKYPSYFPDRPWQARNKCKYIGGSDKYGQYIDLPSIPDNATDKEQKAALRQLASCETNIFNAFAMWSEKAPEMGMGGTDPRFLRIKSKYPQAWSYANIKKRLNNHSISPFIPSPGFAPYVAPPPPGTPPEQAHYKNPNNPDATKALFYDSEDEKLYRLYKKKYDQFMQEYGQAAAEYSKKWFALMPHKQTVSRRPAPNEWSATSYGREKPLWEDGTSRPVPTELARIIKERGLGAVAGTFYELATKVATDRCSADAVECFDKEKIRFRMEQVFEDKWGFKILRDSPLGLNLKANTPREAALQGLRVLQEQGRDLGRDSVQDQYVLIRPMSLFLEIDEPRYPSEWAEDASLYFDDWPGEFFFNIEELLYPPEEAKEGTHGPTPRSLKPQLKGDINKALDKGGFGGARRFKSIGEALNVAMGILSAHGLEQDETLNAWKFTSNYDKTKTTKGGHETIRVAFTNANDPFSPEEIGNSMLAFAWTDLENGIEVIAYMS